MMTYPLTPEHVRHRRIEGCLVAEWVFGHEDLATIDERIRELTDRSLVGAGMSKILEPEPEPLDGRPSSPDLAVLPR